MKLSVIIPCLNGAATIATQLAALARQQWDQPWEIVVADNGSTDESVGIVERYRGRLQNLRVADASARRGRALNVGAKEATGDALVFCDVDDEVAAGG
jgi:glycosyltransferase involved in cell wall biosynthesis